MEKEDKVLAEKVLRVLFAGSYAAGMKFERQGLSTFICFEREGNREPDEAWLHIELKKFAVFPDWESAQAAAAEILPERGEEEALQEIVKVRAQKVASAKLGNMSPHLFLLFESGSVLLVNGFHEQFECWQAGAGTGYRDDWLVVATPGSDIAVCMPEE